MSAVWESQPSIDAPAGSPLQVRVWDGFTRLVHWLLVVLLGVLKVFTVLHLAAVVSSWLFKGDNLVRPMITGSKGWGHGPPPHIEFAPRWHALLGIALAAMLVWYVI